MSKDVIRLTIPDVSDFAKQLRNALTDAPSHVEMLNHVARAAGYRAGGALFRQSWTLGKLADTARGARAVPLGDLGATTGP